VLRSGLAWTVLVDLAGRERDMARSRRAGYCRIQRRCFFSNTFASEETDENNDCPKTPPVGLLFCIRQTPLTTDAANRRSRFDVRSVYHPRPWEGERMISEELRLQGREGE
jgi:hypothetical protein